MSVFATHARKLYELGLSIVPVDGKTKACYHEGWGSFANELPNEDLFTKWETENANDGIGVICGRASNIIAIDFDYTGPDAKLIENTIIGILPISPIAKKGGKGWTKFYKWSELNCPKAISKIVGDKSHRVIDVLDNRLTVLPPTPHKNGNNYTWITEYTLHDINEVDLPYVTDQMILAIEEICKSKGDELLKPKEGRHDVLFGHHLIASRTAKNFDEYKQMLWNKDIVMHASSSKGQYFKDEQSLNKDATRWIESHKKYLKEKKNIDFNFVDDLPDSKEKYSDSYFANKYKSFLSGFHDVNKKGKLSVNYYELANYIHEKYELYYTDAGGYVWNGKCYESIKDLDIKNRMLIACKNTLNPKDLDQAFKIVKALNPRTIADATPGLINLGNGVLNIFTKELTPHSRDLCFNYVNNLNYNKNATCPKWISFLNEVLQNDPELTSIVQEMFGYTIMGGYPFLHKAFILQGEGRNGKSTLLDVLKALIGESNYTSVPLQQLDRPFSAVMLNKKLANILGELTTNVINNEYFKTVVGGEPVIMSNKGKDEFIGKVNARLIFATNGIPTFGDTTAGIYERLCFIPFDTYIEKSRRDPDITKKLIEELPGILNWAIEGSVRVWQNKRLTEAVRSNVMVDAWRNDSDSVKRFINDEINVTRQDHHVLSTAVLYQRYSGMCVNDGCKAFAKARFVTKLLANLKKMDSDFEFNAEKSRNNFIRGVQFKGTLAAEIKCSVCSALIENVDNCSQQHSATNKEVQKH